MKEIDRSKDVLFLTKHLHKILENDFNESLAEFDITIQQARILIFIYRKTHNNEEIVNQKAIEERFVLSKSTVSGFMSRLEKKGFIVRKQESNSISIELSERGLAVIDKIEKNRIKARKQALKCFTKEEEEKFIELLIKMINNVKEENCICGKK